MVQSVYPCSEDRQLFFSKTKYLPKAAEMGMQQKHQRWRRDYGGGGVAILRLRERLGDNQRARLRCVEKVRLRNEANKFHDWKRRAEE